MKITPDGAFERALIAIYETHKKKRKDYAGRGHPNQNFYDTAIQLSLTPGHSVEALIATKQARLKVLLPQFWLNTLNTPANESIADTLLDRAVYSIIAITLWEENGYYIDGKVSEEINE